PAPPAPPAAAPAPAATEKSDVTLGLKAESGRFFGADVPRLNKMQNDAAGAEGMRREAGARGGPAPKAVAPPGPRGPTTFAAPIVPEPPPPQTQPAPNEPAA